MQLLLEGCRKNDRESQRLLYQHYYRYAMSISLRYCAEVEEAREVMNDAFMKVFTKIDQYNRETSFKGWLRRIIINTAIDRYRAELKHRNQEDIENVQIATKQPEVVSDLSYEELLAMIRKLPPAYRAVFNLHVIDGYTHDEIGLILGIAEGTSKSNLVKARNGLKKMLQKSSRLYEKYV